MNRLALKTGIEMAAIVDVVFLLLTFFLLSVSLEKTRAIQIELPRAQGQNVQDARTLELMITKEGRWHLDQKEIAPADLRARLGQLQAPEKVACQVAADAGVPYGRVAELLGLLQASQIRNVRLLTREK